MYDQRPHDDVLESAAARPSRRPRVVGYLVVFTFVLMGLAFGGIVERRRDDKALAQWTDERAIPSVDLVSPHAATSEQHLRLPADIQAFDIARIHSRVNGYVKAWYVDIGAHVKAGDVLARIDTPDLDQSYEQAKGEVAKAQADYNLSVVTAKRWTTLRSSDAVSQQTADEKTSDALARKAQLASAQANLDRLKAMEGFKDITAPFDGVVTARRADIGDLVSATSNNDPGLFDVSSIAQMRIYVRVPQIYTATMHAGMAVALQLPQYPGRTFSGTLDTTADAIGQQSRALLVEALFPNPDGLLTPGAYAQARFDLPLDPHKLLIPPSAMIFRDGAPKVAIVKDGKIALRPIKVAVDTGTEIEVSSGVSAADRIVIDPLDTIADGDVVHVATIDGKPPGDNQVAAGATSRAVPEAVE